MTKKIYQATVGKESKTARAMTTNANISLKYSTEICNQIKGKNADKMLAWFHRIIAHEDFLPLKRYHKKVAHRKGESKEGVKSGRYPEKTLKSFITLVESAKSNADFKGLDDDKLAAVCQLIRDYTDSGKAVIIADHYPGLLKMADITLNLSVI